MAAPNFIEKYRYPIFALILFVIGVSIFFLESDKPATSNTNQDSNIEIPARDSAALKETKYARAKEISSPDGFINTEPFELADYIGKKVILVDFWTYSCINCVRTLPYLKAWDEKYRDKGLVIVGMHTPEFDFEKIYKNVEQFVRGNDIKYPVVLDNDFSTWRAYLNQYWPRKYLIDIDGFIVYDRIGEGGYEETERKIQELLAERMAVLDEGGNVGTDIARPLGAESALRISSQTPEIYFGAWRNEFLGNGAQFARGVQNFVIPDTIRRNFFFLGGSWDVQEKHAVNAEKPSRIVMNYHAAKVFFVAGAENPVSIRVFRGGASVPDAVAGADVRDGKAIIHANRLYRLIDDPSGPGEHTLEIIVEDAGLEAFTFTFG